MHVQHIYSLLYRKKLYKDFIVVLYLRLSLDLIVTKIDAEFRLKKLTAEQFLILDFLGRVEPGDSDLSTSPGYILILYFNKHGVQP